MKKILLTFVLGIFLLSSVSAFMPPTHQYLDTHSLETFSEQGGSSTFYEICKLHPEECYIGNVLTDISVVYYYVNQGAKYEVTHSPGFCVKMMNYATGSSAGVRGIDTEIETACAIGSCIHAAEDYVSHTKMVPYAITHSGLMNEVIHVFAEQKLDNYVQNAHPEVVNEIKSLSVENWNNCIPLIKDVLENEYTDEGYDDPAKTNDLINKFISEVSKSIDPNSNSSYDISFENKVGIFQEVGLIPFGFLILYIGVAFLFGTLAVLLIFRKDKSIINWISIIIFGVIFILLTWLFIALLNGNAFVTLISFVKPISNLVPIGGTESYLEQATDNVHSLFEQGEVFISNPDSSKSKIASGFTELRAANDKVRLLDYFFGIVSLIIMGLLIYKNFKPRRSAFSSSL